MIGFRKTYLVSHVIIWVYGVILINIPSFHLTVGNFNSSDASLLIPSLYGTLLNAAVFYGNWKYLLKRFHLTIPAYWFTLVVGIFVLTVTESFLDHWYVINYLGNKSISFWQGIFVDNLLFHIIFFLLPSYGFWSYEKYVFIKKEQRVLQEQKLQAELSLMRSQINPHFLFNILNNLFASAHNYGDVKTANGISNLAEMMRYMLYDSNEQQVDLEKEINYIEDFIALQKLRFSEQDDITIQHSISIANAASIQIPPMLLIPFVENAFKHGISLEKPSEISIGLSTENDWLKFSCRNSIHTVNCPGSDKNAGFGLKNIKNRLKLLYPDKHKLVINKTDFRYDVQLIINLEYELYYTGR